MPVSSHRRLLDLPDDLATKIDTKFYTDPREALLKGVME
jgi:predicted ATP-dependent Lon-type protease